MIQLTFATRSHRIIAAGSAEFDLYRGLCRRGFCRAAAASQVRAPRPLRDVALVAGRESMQSLKSLVIRIAPLLSPRASIATWIDSTERERGHGIQLLLENMGFRVEAGAKCEIGFVLAARRAEPMSLAQAA